MGLKLWLPFVTESKITRLGKSSEIQFEIENKINTKIRVNTISILTFID